MNIPNPDYHYTEPDYRLRNKSSLKHVEPVGDMQAETTITQDILIQLEQLSHRMEAVFYGQTEQLTRLAGPHSYEEVASPLSSNSGGTVIDILEYVATLHRQASYLEQQVSILRRI